jgi:hypothetical protein
LLGLDRDAVVLHRGRHRQGVCAASNHGNPQLSI